MDKQKSKTTRIVMMSSSLMRLYDVHGPREGLEFHPITFCDPQGCLEMLIESEDKELVPEEKGPEFRAERMERQWGELELRLSFFTDSYRWQ